MSEPGTGCPTCGRPMRDPKHPLAREQREGITMERVREIAHAILHAGDP